LGSNVVNFHSVAVPGSSWDLVVSSVVVIVGISVVRFLWEIVSWGSGLSVLILVELR
jgi:hypothetical protein